MPNDYLVKILGTPKSGTDKRTLHPYTTRVSSSGPGASAPDTAAAHGGREQHVFNRVQRGATGAPSAASAAEDPKRALVHALQNDLSRMSVLLERLDELLSA